MEPDVLATPSDSLVRGPQPSPPAESPALNRSGEMMSATAVPLFTSQSTAAPVASPALAPGHGNGVAHVTGNGNRNGHAWAGGLSASAFTVAYVHSLPHLDVRRDQALYLRCGKRALDFVGALVALVLSAPLLALTAILIKLESPGPVLYKSTRIGRRGRPFTFVKLRSMVNGADQNRHHLSHLNEADGPVFKIINDPRVTRVGRFLRTTSIDEIPQFLNVLRGEMSLVGPRPPLPEEVAHYEPWQMRRLDVRPGITCLWQISGRSRIGFQEWMRLDLEYIKHQSLRLDFKILLRTVPAVISREGAY